MVYAVLLPGNGQLLTAVYASLMQRTSDHLLPPKASQGEHSAAAAALPKNPQDCLVMRALTVVVRRSLTGTKALISHPSLYLLEAVAEYSDLS